MENNSLNNSTIKLLNIEIAQYDLPEGMSWFEAIEFCNNLGDGWRLPTNEELKMLYYNCDEIGEFKLSDYWSSSEFNINRAYYVGFRAGDFGRTEKDYKFKVRIVRNNTSVVKQIDITSNMSLYLGNQVWMSSNLNVDCFRNGDILLEAKTDQQWMDACKSKQPAWCYYQNDPVNGEIYGKIYNWHAVNDVRCICPENYSIPNITDWIKLMNYCWGVGLAGKKLKSTTGWESNGDNESNFSAKPGDYRGWSGCFSGPQKLIHYWSHTLDECDNVMCVKISDYSDNLFIVEEDVLSGFYIRCINDKV